MNSNNNNDDDGMPYLRIPDNNDFNGIVQSE